MDSQKLWERYQNWLYYHAELGFYLDISKMRIDDALPLALQAKFAKAFDDMTALEQGAIANPDENRQVGHYWLRNPELAPAEFKGQIEENLQQIRQFARDVHSGKIHPPQAEKFTDILSIGIGGSALGPQFVDEALASANTPLAIHFIDNTDPAGIDLILNRLKNRLVSTLVVVTSKSGGTPETRNGMMEIRAVFKQQGLNFPAHAVAVTMLGSSMDELEHAEGWLAEFPMFDWVGGRTSEMSSVGLLSALLLGIDSDEILRGAKLMDDATRIPDINNNPAALLALAWYHATNGKGEKAMVVLPYKDSLQLFSRYLQQLVMESLGKATDLAGHIVNQGLTVYGNKGSTDQHAFVQQLREGVANFFAVFIEVLEDRKGPSIEVAPQATSGDYLFGFLYGTQQALYDNKRDSITITLNSVTPRSIGGLIALFERAVGLYASLINVNAYNQPGVEAGKKAAEALLTLQRKVLAALDNSGQALDLEALAAAVGEPDQIEQIYKIIRHLAVNNRGVIVQGSLAVPNTIRVGYHP